MEAISAGASILAFLTLALQCTQSLHETIAGYRNISQQTESLASALKNLESILTQLQSCRILADPSANLQHIKELIRTCVDHLKRHEKVLEEIQPDERSLKTKQIWKRFRATLEEKQLTQIWTEVNHLCTVLGVQLQLLQSDKNLDCENRLIQLNTTLAEYTAPHAPQHTRSLEQSTKISVVNDNVTDLKTLAASQFQALQSLTEQIEALPKISRQQCETVCTLIQALQAQIAGPTTQSTIPHAHSRPSNPAHLDKAALDQDGLDLASKVQSISELVKGKNGRIYNKEAQPIIALLESLVQDIIEEVFSNNDPQAKKRKTSIYNDGEIIDHRDVKRLCSANAASSNVDINIKRAAQYPPIAEGKIIQRYMSREAYALHQPKICAFFIENGADVDEVAPEPDMPWPDSTCPLGIGKYFCALNNKERSTTLECWRLLLRAGADPTMPALDEQPFYPANAIDNGTTEESLRLLLDLGGQFVDLHQRDDFGRTPFLRLAMGMWDDPGSFALFLARGADIHARDYVGMTCLHYSVTWANPNNTELLASLTLLIDKGADVLAVDDFGHSVSHYAYTSSVKECGGYRGDLWDAALARRGYNLYEMRRGFPRKPRYSRRYSRATFERLWSGFEHLCPYYDDVPVWPPGSRLHEVFTDDEEDSDEEAEYDLGLDDNEDSDSTNEGSSLDDDNGSNRNDKED
ncbi:hypothetical protein NA57DRAFT_51122 [Rhizodiscina lignyota]|uniref:Azaphilone pigments biosynthesis cluster protein L N-terminal domain-containing protein n=1 Tax=Rhizodiscina lignyota TaxID=1504668 RepID=A0A9P4IMJ6_9PEZI|nr:hypothetical protein NA57DRAFT_51122 [Rhizodiscina lignyota]